MTRLSMKKFKDSSIIYLHSSYKPVKHQNQVQEKIKIIFLNEIEETQLKNNIP